MSNTIDTFANTVSPSCVGRAFLPHAPLRRSVTSRRRPSMRLEDVAPEESEIIQLEIEIDKAIRNEAPHENLKKKREEVYEAWLVRLEKEIKQSTNESHRDYLNGQLERVRTQYGPPA